MANIIKFDTIEFKNPITNHTTYGFKYYDDYNKNYVNNFPSCENITLSKILNILKDDDFDAYEYILDHGCIFNDIYFDYDDIESLEK